ncbi:MAG: pyridoxamine 5'-phosphate oxidase family protein, partial [Bacteroidia bacterium]
MHTLLKNAQGELLRANADKRHPFRFFTLATLDKYPEVRTVVLRKAKPDFDIVLFTDSRSPKVRHIQASPHVSALFYHPK